MATVKHRSQFGYYNSAWASVPTYDPGLDVPCLICGKPLSTPMVTTSLMLHGDDRSYFYRAHVDCYEALSDDQQQAVDSQLIDAIANAKQNTN